MFSVHTVWCYGVEERGASDLLPRQCDVLNQGCDRGPGQQAEGPGAVMTCIETHSGNWMVTHTCRYNRLAHSRKSPGEGSVRKSQSSAVCTVRTPLTPGTFMLTVDALVPFLCTNTILISSPPAALSAYTLTLGLMQPWSVMPCRCSHKRSLLYGHGR